MQQLQKDNYITMQFPLGANFGSKNNPTCGLTVRSAGSMRFRWNESNPLRDKTLTSISAQFGGGTFVPVQLDHTHVVYDIKEAGETNNLIGDGIITKNKKLIPTVTVADCVPIYLFDPVTEVFGIVHSGWKGTGIVCDAMKLAEEHYGSKAENFHIVIGPHIGDCCYIVNEERANYFAKNFNADCVRQLEEGVQVDWNNGGGRLFRLSLTKANLTAIKKAGVREENIFVHPDCTCCSKDGLYGSNRRETRLAGKPDAFTVQAAFIAFLSN